MNLIFPSFSLLIAFVSFNCRSLTQIEPSVLCLLFCVMWGPVVFLSPDLPFSSLYFSVFPSDHHSRYFPEECQVRPCTVSRAVMRRPQVTASFHVVLPILGMRVPVLGFPSHLSAPAPFCRLLPVPVCLSNHFLQISLATAQAQIPADATPHSAFSSILLCPSASLHFCPILVHFGSHREESRALQSGCPCSRCFVCRVSCALSSLPTGWHPPGSTRLPNPR